MLVRVEFLLLRILAHHPTIEITSYEITDDDTYIESQDFSKVVHPEVKGRSEVKKCVCRTMREPASDKERYSDEQGQIVPFACEGDGSGHDETATDGKQSASDGANG